MHFSVESCEELQSKGETKSGVYDLRIGLQKKSVYCDMDDDGGGWTVLQRRGDFGNKRNNFMKRWGAYAGGFGDPEEDYWIGLTAMNLLTTQEVS